MKVSTKTKSKGKSKSDQLREMREKAVEQTEGSAEESTALAVVEDKDKGDILPPLSEEEKIVKAKEEDARFRELEAAGRKTFAEMAFILRDFKAYELWRYVERRDKAGQPTGKVGFKNWDAWLSDASPLGRSSGYAALKAAEKLLPHIPKKELETMPRYSLDLLAKVPKVKLENVTIRKKLVEAAQTETREELEKTVNEVAPEAHIESKKTIRLDFSLSDNAVGDAFKFCRDVYESETDAESLEVICVDFMDSPCNLEQYAGQSNRQAWESWKQAHKAESTGKEIAAMQKGKKTA